MSESPYRLVVSKRRKTAAIQVKEGQVSVHVPPNTDQQWINQFVADHRIWIAKKIAQQAQLKNEKYQLKEGELFPILGDEKEIQFLRANQYGINVTDSSIKISFPDTDSKSKTVIKACIEFYLQTLAKEYFPKRCQEITQALDIPNQISEIRFKKTKSKWGHCTHKGVLQFNWLIMMSPIPVIDYLAAHECCHLIHPNHSKQFWNLVSSIEPGYQEARLWIKNNGHRLWFE